MLDDLVLHVRREIALDGASGCTWERFWHLIATEQDRLFASSPLAKNKTLPKPPPETLVPDEKYRRYFWAFFLRVKGPVFYIYSPPAGVESTAKKSVSEASLVPMEHLQPIQADQLLYDNVILKYQDTLRIAPTIEARNEMICGMPSAAINFSSTALELLQLVASKRGRGISQSDLSKELGRDPKSIFHLVKTLIKADLLVKIPISQDGCFTQLVLYKSMAKLHPGYCQWFAENQASNAKKSKPAAVMPAAETPTTDTDSTSTTTSSHFNSLAKMRVLNLLRKAKGNIMVSNDLATALRTMQQGRFIVRLLQQLVAGGHIVRVMSEEHGRCIQLAQPTQGTPTLPSSSTNAATKTEADDILGANELAADAQLDVQQMIAKEASSRRGIEFDTSIEYQIVRFVVQSGTTGVILKDILQQFDLPSQKTVVRLLESLTKARKPSGSGLLKRVSEQQGRQHLYRYFSARGLESTLHQDHKEYIEKVGMTTECTPQSEKFRTKRRAAAASKSGAKAASAKGAAAEVVADTPAEASAVLATIPQTPSLPSSSSSPVVTIPDAADTIPAVEPSSPLSILPVQESQSETTGTTLEFDGMPPPPVPTSKGKGKASSSDSAVTTPISTEPGSDATATAVSPALAAGPPASPSSKKIVDLAAWERRAILLDMINEYRIIEFGQSMINGYQRKLQERNPTKKLTTIDRKTLMNYGRKLEQEGYCKTLIRSTMSASGTSTQRKFLMHKDEDPDSEKVRLYIDGCLSRRMVNMAVSLRPERIGKVEVQVERLEELSERLQEEMPLPLPLPKRGLTRPVKDDDLLDAAADADADAENGTSGKGEDPEATETSTVTHFEQVATKYGFRRAKMMRVRHFHEYIFRMAHAAAPTADGKEPVIKTSDILSNMPLNVFLTSIGVFKEVPLKKQSQWLLENGTLETPLKDLPLDLSYLAHPTAYFKRRLREMFEVLDALELVTPLVPRTVAQGATSSATAPYSDDYKESLNHMVLNPYYHIHLNVDPGLVRLVKVQTDTRMRLQTPVDLQNYWIIVMRVTQFGGSVKKAQGSVKEDEDEDDGDDAILRGDGEDLLTETPRLEGSLEGEANEVSEKPVGIDPELYRVMQAWSALRKRLLKQLYNKRFWMLNKVVTPAQALILDKFARYDERSTPIHSLDLLAKAARAAGVDTAEAKKHYLEKLYYQNQKDKRQLAAAAAGLGDTMEEEDFEGLVIKGKKAKKAKGGAQRLTSTKARSKTKSKGKEKKIDTGEETPLQPRKTRGAANRAPRGPVDFEDESGEDEKDRDYRIEDEDGEEEAGKSGEDDEGEDDDEMEEEASLLFEADRPKRRRAPRILWTDDTDNQLLVLFSFASYISVFLHTRKSWKGVNLAFPGRNSESCRRRLSALRRNPTYVARLKLYEKKWARIFQPEDRVRFLNHLNEIKDPIGLLEAWEERQGFVHVAEDFDEDPLTRRRHLGDVDLPLHVSKLHTKYSVIRSMERRYTMFYIDEKDLPRLSQPQQVAMVASWPVTLRSIATEELDLRFNELEDLPATLGDLDALLLPKVPQPTLLAASSSSSSSTSSNDVIVVKPSARERYRDEHLIQTLWKSVFHLPAHEIERSREYLRSVLSYYSPDTIAKTSVLTRDWKVLIRHRARGSRIPGQPLTASERFIGAMLGAISRVRSNNAAGFMRALYPRRIGGGGGSAADMQDTLKAQLEFNPLVNASQMMALIHALEANRLIFSASATEITAMDQDILPLLTATVLDRHPIETTVGGGSGDGVTSTAIPSAAATDEATTTAMAKKSKKRMAVKEEVTVTKRLRDDHPTNDLATPQAKGVYRSWEEVYQVSKAEMHKYLDTISDSGRREVFEKVHEIVATTGSQGILMVDLKDTILKVHFTRSTPPTDKEILETVKTLETLCPPTLLKVGLAVPRYVANGFQLPWVVKMPKALAESEESERSTTTATATKKSAPESALLKTDEIDLADFKAPRMWQSLDGTRNAITFEKLCHSVLTLIVQQPGITLGLLERSVMHKILLPVELEEILTELEQHRGAIVSRAGQMPAKSSLFSKRAIFRPCDPRQTIDRRMITMYFPNTASGKAYYEFLDMALVRAHHGEDLGARTAHGALRIREDGTRGTVEGQGSRQRRRRMLEKRAQEQQQQQQQVQVPKETSGRRRGIASATSHGETDDDGQGKSKDRKAVKSIKTDETGKILGTGRRRGRPTVEMLELDETMVSDDDNDETSSTTKPKEGNDQDAELEAWKATLSGEDVATGADSSNDSSVLPPSSLEIAPASTPSTLTAAKVQTSLDNAGEGSSKKEGKLVLQDQTDLELETELEEEEEQDELPLGRRRRVLHSDIEDVDEDEDGFTGVIDDEDEVILGLEDDDEGDDDDEEEDDPAVVGYEDETEHGMYEASEEEDARAYKKQRSMSCTNHH
ncbi:hypothetical protein BGZ73_008479 [Actinomortierella ambigua]|nr:hypothetical protein BGZ73_008479 [Actinomortierella ambigua]